MRVVAQSALALLLNITVLSPAVKAVEPLDFFSCFNMPSHELARNEQQPVRSNEAEGIHPSNPDTKRFHYVPHQGMGWMAEAGRKRLSAKRSCRSEDPNGEVMIFDWDRPQRQEVGPWACVSGAGQWQGNMGIGEYRLALRDTSIGKETSRISNRLTAGLRVPTRVVSSPHPPPAVPSVVRIETPRRVLFIGNSFTYYNDGIDHHLNQLARSASPPVGLVVKSQTTASQDLMGHYLSRSVIDTIRSQNWDVVILQGYSNEPIARTKRDRFVKYAQLLDHTIQEAGAKTVFFMTWAYRHTPRMTRNLQRTYVAMGNELDALVVPVGLAWDRALQERPTLRLYRDSKHPSHRATYLSACVFYAALLSQSPVGLPYTADLGKDEATFFQRIAWETVEAFYRH